MQYWSRVIYLFHYLINRHFFNEFEQFGVSRLLNHCLKILPIIKVAQGGPEDNERRDAYVILAACLQLLLVLNNSRQDYLQNKVGLASDQGVE